MKHTTIFAAALTLLGIARQASAAEMTLVRNSRPVTAAEVAGGAPAGGMVHDFRLTSDADLLSLSTFFNQWVYQHPYGNDHSEPHPQLVAVYPALGANSFFRFPSSTLVLGGGFVGPGPERAWGDVNNDGPQTNFLFGRLTTSQSGSYTGQFAVRGPTTYVEMPFSFALPGTSGPLTETLLVSGAEQSYAPYTPPEQSTAPGGEEATTPEPRLFKPSRVEVLTSWLTSMPQLSPPPTSDILAFKESLQRDLPRPRKITGTLEAIPEPAAWILCVACIPLLLRRRAA